MMTKIKYSDKEIKMFLAIGIDPALIDHLEPMSLYRAAVSRCFMQDLSGPAVTSLRACLQGFDRGVYRGTAEFENLIQLT